MKTALASNAPVTGLDIVLRSAVVLNWEALAGQSQPRSVRLEYHIGMDGAVDFLKLWACGREYWSLICDYSLHRGWDGPRFANGFHSRSLGRQLQAILMNQNLFQNNCSPNSNGMLEIRTPTSEEAGDAMQWMTKAFPLPA